MPRPQKAPLRPLTTDEHVALTRLSRAHAEPAAHVARAKALLAVAVGQSFTDAARAAGRTSGDAVAHLVARFNRAGVAAVTPGHGGGQPKRYTASAQERILREARRAPDREKDQTGTWSLTTLQRALRQAPDGLPTVSTSTIWQVLHDAGLRWQRDRSWCETGVSVRKRKSGTVLVHDPDAVAKKS
ncbi:MAG: helix-turn-helix domain-containing protein [Ktedonobacterales bacterium]|nr:helix-turn-helix domain-containing protein [Ktedonobacterales bacterium]